MTIKSIKHRKEKRAHIPSREEAGVEDASAKVRRGAKKAEISVNPVVHRGQDPELFWLAKGVDDDYDGSNFVCRQVFFCGGDKDEFDKWRKGLANLAADGARKRAEKTLKVEIDEDAFARLYGHTSHPIEVRAKGQKIAVRVISQFGEECTKVLST